MNISNSARMFSELRELNEVHGPFRAADVRVGEQVSAVCRIPGQDAELTLQVWRISPLGLELILPENSAELAIGSEIDLAIRIGKQQSHFTGLIVAAQRSDGHRRLIGIRWSQPALEARDSNDDRRSTGRWLCGNEFLPTGVAPNPARFNDFIHFRVRDISKDGMQIITSLRNKFIVPGMVFETVISLPTIGQLNLNLQAINARITADNGKDFLSLGVKVLNPTPKSSQMLGQFILQFGPSATLDALRKSGFDVDSSLKAVDFSYVRSADEYRQVLELRKHAYSQYGNASNRNTPESVSDIYDARARILVARYRGEPIGSLRLIFNELDDMYEHENLFTIPKDFPRKDEVVEISRVCTHPSYRGNDLLLGLFRHALVAILQSNRRYILGYTTLEMSRLYTRMGAVLAPMKFRLESYEVDLYVFLIDARGILAGAGINPIVWNALFDDMVSYLDTSTLLDSNPMTNVRLALYRLMAPFSQLIRHRMSKPRRKSSKTSKKAPKQVQVSKP